jgi:hypothetical protein
MERMCTLRTRLAISLLLVNFNQAHSERMWAVDVNRMVGFWQEKHTLLLEATRCEHLDVVKYLVEECEADVHAKDIVSGLEDTY